MKDGRVEMGKSKLQTAYLFKSVYTRYEGVMGSGSTDDVSLAPADGCDGSSWVLVAGVNKIKNTRRNGTSRNQHKVPGRV
jgi:hypothetical protein